MTTRWPRWGLAALLTCTAAMYLWNLSASDYGNAFYAAAAQAGSQSWSADKPPGGLWVTGLSIRLFGMSTWSVLVPQAMMGVAAVAVLFAAVRRVVPDPVQGAVAGLIAGAVLACTPAAALMFRFNNPDALLVLLLVVAAHCLARAVQAPSWRWLALVGAVMGTAFLTKMLQGFLVLPGFGLGYLLTAPTTWRKRLLHLAGALGAFVASAGWWVLVVQLIPAQSRPYIGGSTNNTVLNLAFGYNGLGRLVGHESDWGGPAVGSTKAPTGLHRLFTTEMGNEISWLLPVALFATAFGAYLAVRGRLARDERAAVMSWGGWLLVTVVVFSYMLGTIHPYYTVALAPAIGALIGLSAVWAWRSRVAWDGRIAMAGMLGLGGWWSSVLLQHNHFGPPSLPIVVLVTSLAGAVCVGVGRQWPMATGLVAGATAAVAGTVAYSVATVATPHHGAIPNAVSLTHATPGLAERSRSAGGPVTKPPTATWRRCSPRRRHRGRPRPTDRSRPRRWSSRLGRRSWRSADGAATPHPLSRSSSTTCTPGESQCLPQQGDRRLGGRPLCGHHSRHVPGVPPQLKGPGYPQHVSSSQPDVAAPVDPPIPVPDVAGADATIDLTLQQKLTVDSSAVADLGLRTAIASLVGVAMLPRVAGAALRPNDTRAERDATKFTPSWPPRRIRNCPSPHRRSRRGSRRDPRIRSPSGRPTAGCATSGSRAASRPSTPRCETSGAGTHATTSCTPSTGSTTTAHTRRCA